MRGRRGNIIAKKEIGGKKRLQGRAILLDLHKEMPTRHR